MVVVFPLTENLPVAVAMVGAPAVGGALWAIDKLLSRLATLWSRLTSANYRLSGTWSEPSVELKSVFDSSPDSKPAGASSSAVLSPRPLLHPFAFRKYTEPDTMNRTSLSIAAIQMVSGPEVQRNLVSGRRPDQAGLGTGSGVCCTAGKFRSAGGTS